MSRSELSEENDCDCDDEEKEKEKQKDDYMKETSDRRIEGGKIYKQ